MGRAAPDSDPVAEARMKFELDNRTKRGLLSKMVGPFASSPNLSNAAKSGNPSMETFKPTMPLDVPDTAKGIGATTNEVTIGPVTNRDILDKAPDARAAGTPAAGDAAADKPADKPATANADGSAAAPAAGAPAAAAPAAAPAAAAKAAKPLKPPKPPKQVAPKKRPRPADNKKGAPATPDTAAPPTPAKTSGGNGPGGTPEAPRQ